MKFPSVHSLYSSILYVVKRFPFEISFALLGVLAATTVIEISSLNVKLSNLCTRLIMVADLGLVLSLSATLISENRQFTFARKASLRFLAIVIAFLLFFLLDPLNREADYIRFVLLALAFHLMVAFAPFAGKNYINAFWQFNKTIFLRFLTGALYSIVLYAGLSAAIGSMNLLFNFQFEWDTFAILWVWIAGLFQTVFFLSGVPGEVKVLEGDKSYPKGLKIFTQYVLIPLASVYVVILLSYEVKILLQWELPKGVVSKLILSYAVFGILSLLLVFPIRNLQENKWVKSYSRSFYFLLIPLIFLLVWAVAARVLAYGITEQRYFLMVLAVWLAFITAYFLISIKQDIRVIPISLCLATLFTVYGPQGAFAVSQISQINQLQGLFEKYGALENQMVQPLSKPVDSADRERMTNVLTYLVNKHGTKSVERILPVNVGSIEKHFSAKFTPDSAKLRSSRYLIAQNVNDSLLRALKLPVGINDERYGIETKRLVQFKLKDPQILNISGYQKLVTFNSNSSNLTESSHNFKMLNKEYRVKVNLTNRIIISQGANNVFFDMKPFFEKHLSSVSTYQRSKEGPFLIVPEEEMFMEKTLNGTVVRLQLQDIQGGYRKDKNKELYILYYNGVLLFK